MPMSCPQSCAGSSVHEQGVYHLFFCAFLFYSLEFMQGFRSALPAFPYITSSPRF